MTRWGTHTLRRFAPPTAFTTGGPPLQRWAAIRGGFTLVELVLVLAIVSIFAGIAVPRCANFVAQQRVEAAVRRIKTDLALAQRRARFSSSQQKVIFNVVPDKYTLPGMQDPDHPGQSYRVKIGAEPYNATIVSANFGGKTHITFDGYGTPDSGGTVVVQVGNYQRTITVDGEVGIPHGGAPIE